MQHRAPQNILFLNLADARAGGQRVGATTIACLREAGCRVHVWLGFGGQGFLTRDAGARAFLSIETIRLRKLLYPVWLAVANLRAIFALIAGETVWVNAVYALPAALAPLLARPSRLVIHVHELEMPALFRWLTGVAARRGAHVIAVSGLHAHRLGFATDIIGNSVGRTPPAADPGDHIVFIGDSRPIKRFDLFVAIAEQGLPWPARAVLAGTAADYPPDLLRRAQAAGVALCFGLTEPAAMLAGAALMLQLTDPKQATETFSLTTAEAVWHLVPVGGAGTEVIAEIAGPALAFNLPSDDPADFARAIHALAADPQRHAALVAQCARIRPAFSLDRYRQAVLHLIGMADPPTSP